MIVRYWHPFQEMETLRRQLNQVFEDVTNSVETAPNGWAPAIRLVEASDRYTLTVQLAGIDPAAVDVQVTREAVLLTGEHKAPEVTDGDRVLYDNLPYGTFRRTINLPEAVQNDAVEAEFNHGLLILQLPKAEARNGAVKINLGQLDSNSRPAIAAEVPAEAN